MKIKNSFLYKYIKETYVRLVVWINPEKEIDRCYYKIFRRHCNLKEPKDLIEKIFWMELHTDTSMWTKCADKYRVRDYIEQCGCGEYLPKLYGHWDKASDVDFAKLPSSFVIKANNGCGTVKVVKDKAKINGNAIKKELKKWLALPYGYTNAQLHYTHIKPCVIAEELLKNDYESLSPESLVDFKIWCFNGEPQWVFVAYNRKPEKLDIALFDTEWQAHPEYINMKSEHYHYKSEVMIPRPKSFSTMLELARKISQPFKEIRVDFYEVDRKPVIGELTFSTGYGYFTEQFYKMLGDKLNILDRCVND